MEVIIIKINVTDTFIRQSLEMANDLYGMAEITHNVELKKKFRTHIKKCRSYLTKNSGCCDSLIKDCKLDCDMCPCKDCDKRFDCDGGNPSFCCDG